MQDVREALMMLAADYTARAAKLAFEDNVALRRRHDFREHISAIKPHRVSRKLGFGR
jgi:hypothetical protein